MRYSSFVSSFERQNNLLLHWQLREKRGFEMFPCKVATFIEKEKKDCFNEYHNLLGNFWF